MAGWMAGIGGGASALGGSIGEYLALEEQKRSRKQAEQEARDRDALEARQLEIADAQQKASAAYQQEQSLNSRADNIRDTALTMPGSTISPETYASMQEVFTARPELRNWIEDANTFQGTDAKGGLIGGIPGEGGKSFKFKDVTSPAERGQVRAAELRAQSAAENARQMAMKFQAQQALQKEMMTLRDKWEMSKDENEKSRIALGYSQLAQQASSLQAQLDNHTAIAQGSLDQRGQIANQNAGLMTFPGMPAPAVLSPIKIPSTTVQRVLPGGGGGGVTAQKANPSIADDLEALRKNRKGGGL